MLGQIIGSGIGAVAGLFGQSSANRANLNESEKNRAFQGDVLKRRHQIEVEDLKKAGLNPMLAMNGGASGAAGSQAHVENEAQSAVTAARELGMMKSQMDVNEQSVEQSKSQTHLNSEAANKVGVEQKILKHNEKATKAESQYRIDKANMDRKLLKVDKAFGYGTKVLNSLATGAGIVGGAGILKGAGALKGAGKMKIPKFKGGIDYRKGNWNKQLNNRKK